MKTKKMNLKTTVVFKQFKRKSYAVFNSLKQIVRISVLPLSCLTFAQTSNVLAQSSNISNIEHNLQSIEVIGESPSEITGRISKQIEVINKEDIAKQTGKSLDELLESASGIDIRQRGVNGTQSDISIRGGSFDQVLIFLNGINITDPQTGHHNLNIPIHISAIDKIEVLQGSNTRTVGFIPFSGAINIITGEKNKTTSDIEIVAGNYGFTSQNANVNIVSKAFKSFSSISKQSSSGYINNTDFDIRNIFSQAIYTSPKTGNIQLQIGYQDKAYGANSFYSLSYPNQYEQIRTLFSSLSWDKKINSTSNFIVKSYWRELHDRFELFRDMKNAASFYNGHNYHQTDILGTQAKINNKNRLGKSTIGIDFRQEQIFSNVLGDISDKEKKALFESDIIFTKEKKRILYNTFIDHIVYLNKTKFSAGLVYQYSEDFKKQLSGGFDVDYELNKNTNLYSNINHTFRLPTFTDLYYQSAIQKANPNIQPEKSTNIEVGIKHQKNKLKIQADVYYRLGKDIIDWIKMPDSTKWESKNITQINTLGTDLLFDYHFNQWIDNIQFKYSYLQLDKASTVYDSKYALDYLKHKISMNINHKIYKNISLHWNLSYQDREGNYSIDNEKFEYESFFITDVKILWKKNDFSVFCDINNLFDIKYQDFGGLKQPGIWIKTGVKIIF